MILLSLVFLYLVSRSINKNKFSFEYAQLWFFIGFVMLIFALFNQIPEQLANLFGFELTSNFLLFVGIIFLMVLAFTQSLQLSRQKIQINNLIQEISIMQEEVGKESKRNEK